MQDNRTPGGCAQHGPGDTEEPSDNTMVCQSVTLYALRGWFDAAVDRASAGGDQGTPDAAFIREVERLRATLHAAVDAAADLKLSVGAESRIQ